MTPVRDAADGAPLLLGALLVTAFVLLFLYPSVDTDPAAEGRVLSFLRISALAPEEACVDRFPVAPGFERIGLNHRFDTAIRPRAALVAPNGTTLPAVPTSQGLLLEVARPAAGNWTLRVWVEPTAGVASHIDRGQVYILGFPPGMGEERQASKCQGSYAGP